MHGDPGTENRVPRLNSQTTLRTVLHHANDTSKASHHQPLAVGHVINQDRDDLGANKEIDDSNNDADDEDEDRPNQRRTRTSNSNVLTSQLRFYSGTWVDVLIAAKNNYRLFIHNEDSFPERTVASLEDARACLLDAIGKFREESQLPLDERMLIQS